jgi:hypothetical protein
MKSQSYLIAKDDADAARQAEAAAGEDGEVESVSRLGPKDFRPNTVVTHLAILEVPDPEVEKPKKTKKKKN